MGYLYEQIFQSPLFPEPFEDGDKDWYKDAIRKLTEHAFTMLDHRDALALAWSTSATKEGPRYALYFPSITHVHFANVAVALGGFLVDQTTEGYWEEPYTHFTRDGFPQSRSRLMHQRRYTGYPFCFKAEIDAGTGPTYYIARGENKVQIPPEVRYRYPRWRFPNENPLFKTIDFDYPNDLIGTGDIPPFLEQGGLGLLVESLDTFTRVRNFARDLVHKV